MKVFISYSSKDRALVEALSTDLDALGYNVWFDKELTGGHLWWSTILAAIRDCDLFIFALTPQSFESYPCRLEYTYANKLHKRVLPVLLQSVNTALLPPELSQIQFVNYLNADKRAISRLAKALKDIPDAQALPDPLPDEPETPISPLGRLNQLILESPKLDRQQQIEILFDLRNMIADPGTRDDARLLLQRMLEREDTTVKVGDEIKTLLESSAVMRRPVRKTQQVPAARVFPFSRGLLTAGAVVMFLIIGGIALSAYNASLNVPTATQSQFVAQQPSRTVDAVQSTTEIPAAQNPTSTSTDNPTFTPIIPTTTVPDTATSMPSETFTATKIFTATASPTYTPTATKVPPIATNTATYTATKRPPTATPTLTPTPVTPTATWTDIPPTIDTTGVLYEASDKTFTVMLPEKGWRIDYQGGATPSYFFVPPKSRGNSLAGITVQLSTAKTAYSGFGAIKTIKTTKELLVQLKTMMSDMVATALPGRVSPYSSEVEPITIGELKGDRLQFAQSLLVVEIRVAEVDGYLIMVLIQKIKLAYDTVTPVVDTILNSIKFDMTQVKKKLGPIK